MRILRVLMIGLAFLLATTGSVTAQDKEEQIKSLVDKAAATFKEKGRDYTLKLIGTISGPFRKGELYVFAVSTDNLMLAHPANRKLVGKDMTDFKGAKGKQLFKEFNKVAMEQGSGWVEYYWLRHGEQEPTLKRSYIKKVPDEDIYVGGGYYIK
ncbi:cache domain-containing protein [Thermodesulfobacteriota bacterium]